jgi:hypothetical protein
MGSRLCSPRSQLSRRARVGRSLKNEKIYQTRIVALAKVLIDELLRGGKRPVLFKVIHKSGRILLT